MRSALFAVAALLAMTTAAAQPLPDELRTAPVTVAEYQQYNEELELVRALARQRSADARIALARLFVERAQSAQAEGQYDLAFRYLIAGARVSPQNSAIFRAGLAQAVHATNDYFQIESPSWAAFYDAGDGLFLVGRRQNVELWNGRTRSLVRSFAADDRVENEPHQYEARLSADRRRLIVVGDALTQPVPLRLWDVETGALVHRYDFGAWISEPRFSPNGETFMMRVIRGEDGEFQLRRSSDGAELTTIRACCRASFSADSRVMVVAARDRLHVVDASTGAAQAEIDLRPLLPAEALRRGWIYVELSPDGRWVLLQQDLSDNSYIVGLSGAEPSVLRLWAAAGPATNPTAGNYVRGQFLGWADASRVLVRIPGDAEALAYVDARSGAVTPTRYADLDARSRSLLARLEEGETSSLVRNPESGETAEIPRRVFAVDDRSDLIMTKLDNFELHRPGHSDFIVRTLDATPVARLPGHNLYVGHGLIDWREHAALSAAGPHVRFWPNDEGHALWRGATAAEAAALGQRWKCSQQLLRSRPCTPIASATCGEATVR